MATLRSAFGPYPRGGRRQRTGEAGSAVAAGRARMHASRVPLGATHH
jgi:hypothetical protein